MKMENNIRIRYGRNKKGSPKNTLVTIRDGELLYFGISRCNVKVGDTFQKDAGKHIAYERALLSSAECPVSDGLCVHKSGLRGVVEKESVRKLIEYFENIERFSKDTWNKAIL
jgi:hypothetical protein